MMEPHLATQATWVHGVWSVRSTVHATCLRQAVPSLKMRALCREDGSRSLSVRAVLAGLLVGSILTFSNTYFGLQTGWVTMGSLQVIADL